MRSIWFLILLGSLITYHCLTTVAGEEAKSSTDASQPTLEQCKGYVDAALKTSSPEGETEEDAASTEDSGEPPDGDGTASTEQGDSSEEAGDDSKAGEEGASEEVEGGESEGATAEDDGQSTEADDNASQEGEGTAEEQSEEDAGDATTEDDGESKEENADTAEEGQTAEEESNENGDGASEEDANSAPADTQEDGESEEATAESENATTESEEAAAESENATVESEEATAEDGGDATAEGDSGEATAEENDQTAEDSAAPASEEGESAEDGNSAEQDGVEQESAEEGATAEDSGEDAGAKSDEDDKSVDGDTQEDTAEEKEPDSAVSGDVAEQADQPDESGESQENQETQEDQATAEDADSPEAEAGVSEEGDSAAAASEEGDSGEATQASDEEQNQDATEEEASSEEEEEQEYVEPYEPRSRDHITQILGLDDSEETKASFTLLDKVTTTTLKELKSTYENAIKPLEHLYKYRDLSNRHFGDPEIFSKPLIVFMGPWSGGKSTIINWLLGIQHEDNALRTGADPSPAQFNIMMYGKEPEKLDGTQLAADWTFSGLQKFGQSFLDRLRGQKLPNRLLEKVNIVEIPGILEVRKQVERSFPFNDACQWFIDRADTLFLIYDPAKLDIGPETEAILDQLKGRENQVRIVLNKADTVKPDELLRVQAMLVWNISPLMSSAEPPIMYAASLWDHPLQPESPKSLLVAHENNFLKDIRDGVERRVETRIAAARRFAVRVRNHAKMVDCYLNTFNNHRSFFGDRKKITTDIIDHPQNYHIYEGLSTLNNISRYDLPDPDTYRDFFRINPLWDFPTLQSTCSFWRGCPLHKLDIAIAYDLPEILGKFRRQRESLRSAQKQGSSRI